MILKAIIDDQIYSLDVPDTVIAQGEEFFAELDLDMDKGWQMSRDWVDNPSQIQRGQIGVKEIQHWDLHIENSVTRPHSPRSGTDRAQKQQRRFNSDVGIIL